MITGTRGRTSLRLLPALMVAWHVAANEGCVRPAAAPSSAAVTPVMPQPLRATVVVRNHHWADLRIYAMTSDGTSHRLGLVPRFGATTLALPHLASLPAGLTLVAIPLSGDEPQVIGPVVVEIGMHLVLTVESTPSASTLVKGP